MSSKISSRTLFSSSSFKISSIFEVIEATVELLFLLLSGPKEDPENVGGAVLTLSCEKCLEMNFGCLVKDSLMKGCLKKSSKEILLLGSFFKIFPTKSRKLSEVSIFIVMAVCFSLENFEGAEEERRIGCLKVRVVGNGRAESSAASITLNK